MNPQKIGALAVVLIFLATAFGAFAIGFNTENPTDFTNPTSTTYAKEYEHEGLTIVGNYSTDDYTINTTSTDNVGYIVTESAIIDFRPSQDNVKIYYGTYTDTFTGTTYNLSATVTNGTMTAFTKVGNAITSTVTNNTYFSGMTVESMTIGETAYTGYTFSNGILSIPKTDITGNVAMSLKATNTAYTFTSTVTSGTSHTGTVYAGSTVNYTFVPYSSDYTYPTSVVCNVVNTYNATTGTLTIDGNAVNQNVTVTATCGAVGTTSRLPEVYTEVEYIESDGTVYISIAEYTITNLDTTRIRFNSQSQSLKFLTGSNPSSPTSNDIGVWVNQSTLYIQNGNSTRKTIGITSTDDVILEITPQSYKVTKNGVLTTVSYTNAPQFSQTETLYLLWASGDANYRMFAGKLYSYEHWNINGDKDIDLVPCVYNYGQSDATIGLYDMVGGGFYEADTGTLTAGGVVAPTAPDIPPSTPVTATIGTPLADVVSVQSGNYVEPVTLTSMTLIYYQNTITVTTDIGTKTVQNVNKIYLINKVLTNSEYYVYSGNIATAYYANTTNVMTYGTTGHGYLFKGTTQKIGTGLTATLTDSRSSTDVTDIDRFMSNTTPITIENISDQNTLLQKAVTATNGQTYKSIYLVGGIVLIFVGISLALAVFRR